MNWARRIENKANEKQDNYLYNNNTKVIHLYLISTYMIIVMHTINIYLV